MFKILPKHFQRYFVLLASLSCMLPSFADEFAKGGIIYSLDETNNTAMVKGVESKTITSAIIRERAQVAMYWVMTIMLLQAVIL